MHRFLLPKKALLLGALALTAIWCKAQPLSGNYTVGANGSYTSLTQTGGLFDAINTNGMSGNVTVTVISNLQEDGAVTLNDYTSGGANSNKLKIVPAGATEYLIAPATTTVTNGMITFNGVRNLTIDGSFAGSGNYLKFRNDNSGNNANTIRFQNGCTVDTVRNCILESASATTVPANNTQKAATVLLDATTTLGNDNLVFVNNIFQDVNGAASLPATHLRSITTSNTVDNNSITVIHNQFANVRGEGVRTGTNGTFNTLPWIISNNYFYATVMIPGTVTKSAIYVNKGSGHIISNNLIGGADTLAEGSPYTCSGGQFAGIYVNSGSGSTQPVYVFKNRITNILASTAIASASTLYGINSNGIARIDSNIIGGSGIGNKLQTNGCSLNGIFVGANTDTVTGNVLKSLVATFKNTSSTQRNVNGIVLNTGAHYIFGNTIDSVIGSNSSNAGAAAPSGIYIYSATVAPGSVISNNSITNIVNTDTTSVTDFAASVVGVNINTSNTNQPTKIIGNYFADIYGLNPSLKSNNVMGILDGSTGIGITNSYINNVMVMGSNGLVSSGSWVRGVHLSSGSSNITFEFINNTILLSPQMVLASDISGARGGAACISRLNGTQHVRAQNNILANMAANSGTGKMPVINFMVGSPGSFTTDYNVFNTTNNDSLITLSGTSYSLSDWKIISNSDTNSTNAAVPFVSTTDLHINGSDPAAWNAFGRGIANASVATDKDGASRNVAIGIPVTAGAYEIMAPTATPADMVMTPAIPTASTPTVFWSNGRKVAEITWAAGATLPSTLSAKFYPGVQAPGLSASPNAYAHFDVAETGFAGNYTIKQYINDAERNGIAYPSMQAVKRHAANPYTVIAVAGNNNIDMHGNYLTSSPQSSFSVFSITGGNPLAVRLKSITAQNIGAANRISWATAQEEKGDLFELQKSKDGKAFTTIATQDANGLPQAYTHIDNDAGIGTSYYRLLLTTAGKDVSYSQTVSATVQRDDAAVRAFPNPCSEILTVEVANSRHATIELLDMTGRVLKKYDLDGSNIQLDVKGLNAGNYLLKVTGDSSNSFLKIVKL